MPWNTPRHKPVVRRTPVHRVPEPDRQARRALPTNSKAWRAIRSGVLAREPLCRECGTMGTCTGCGRLMPIRSRTNVSALCQTCYRRDPSSYSTCRHCGAVGSLWRIGICMSCAWPRQNESPPESGSRPRIVR